VYCRAKPLHSLGLGGADLTRSSVVSCALGFHVPEFDMLTSNGDGPPKLHGLKSHSLNNKICVNTTLHAVN
ncbi:hypothetical protein L9F63_023453, partial [Diploptera punctata]